MEQYDNLFALIQDRFGAELLQSEMDEIVAACEPINGVAALRAENAQLYNGLKSVMREMDRIWHEFEIGDELPRSLGRHIIKATKPDPVYAAAPEMLEALEECLPIIKHFIKNHDFVTTEKAEAAIAKAKSTIPA